MSWKFAATATQAVLRSGAIQRQRYGTDFKVEHKGVIDLVTEVDRACEEVILETIRESFPDHDVVAEESGTDRKGSSYTWYVDPLDGTTNFAHGYPCFCATVALVKDGEVVVGATYDPLREELFTAERGAGAHFNDEKLSTSDVSELKSALLITGFPYDIHDDVLGKLGAFHGLLGRAQAIRRDGSAAIDLAYLAAGRCEGFFEAGLKLWDCLAGSILVEEAGGRVSHYDGSPLGLDPSTILVSNGPLHDEMLDVVRSADKTPS